MRTHNRGFTLIELLIVIVIIGILVAIVVPKFGNGKERAMVTAMRSDLHNLVTAQEAYFTNGMHVLQRPRSRPVLLVQCLGERDHHAGECVRRRAGAPRPPTRAPPAPVRSSWAPAVRWRRRRLEGSPTCTP